MGIFWCYFRKSCTAVAFKKRNKDFNTLNNILVQDSCPLKTEIARIPLKAVVFLIKLFHLQITSYSGENNTF